MTHLVREQQRLQELCSASIRALSGDSRLQLRGWRLYRNEVAVAPAPPHLQPLAEHDDLHASRGAADGLALRERATDPGIHATHAPADPQAGRVFDLLEQYRVESLVPDEYEGIRRNLWRRHEQWAEAFVQDDLLQTEHGYLIYAVAQACRARVTGIALEDHVEDRIEAARIALAARIGGDMVLLRKLRHDQGAYAVVAARIAVHVAERLNATEAGAVGKGNGRAGSRKRGLSLWLADASQSEQDVRVAGLGSSRLLEGGASSYRAFTRAYDVERDATTLVRTELLRSLREDLDAGIARSGVNVARLARHLQAVFATPTEDGWNSAQEEGRIDGRLLSQLVASPTERRLFRQVRREPVAECVVSVLLDCSGSMKAHAPRLALLVDVLVRALEQAGIDTEVLGFTTGAWNGGRARRDWSRAGSPAHPGRLNELVHLVFKPADESWRRCRRGIAALLKPDLYREGVDGEAVEWACARLRGRSAKRRVLMVVSDGSPMDGATALANDPFYLDHHLQEVVATQSACGDIEIRGLGVGLDLSPYYAKSLVLDLSRPVSLRTFIDVSKLLAGRP